MMRLRTTIAFCCAALLTAGLFLLPALLNAKDAKEVELRFDGRPKVGEPYVISVNTRQVRTYRMKLVGIDNPPRRRETHEIHAVGELVYQSLDPLVIQFKVEALNQTVDGVKTDYAPLAGMTAIVRSSGVNLRDIPVGTEEDAAESVLGGGSASGASDTKKKTTKEIREMLPGARRLIASMFSAPLDHPEEYLGKSRKVKPGEKWTASAKPMLEAIKANGLELAEDKVTATATYNNPSKFYEGNILAQNVFFLAESANIPGYDFKLEVHFQFPDDGDDPPFRVERSATEVVNRAIPEGVPGFSGSVMDCVTTVQSDVAMIRKSKMKTKKKNWFLDLFD
jgi:hypothetical protein